MPTFDESLVRTHARRLQLVVNVQRRRLGAGNHLGAGAGASMDFHDHRDYVAGDDLRHLDWGVLARTDKLMLRRYRQEVSPSVDILCDMSASVGVAPEKAAMTVSLSALLALLAHDAGCRPRLWVLNDGCQRLSGGVADWFGQLHALKPMGVKGLDYTGSLGFPAGSDRYLVSDALTRTAAHDVVSRFGRQAARLSLLQVLTREEQEPEPRGPVRLIDCEGGSNDFILNEQACESYKQRFQRHQVAWQHALRGRGPQPIVCTVEQGFEQAVQALAIAQVVQFAAGGAS